MPKRLKVAKTHAGKITAYAILFQVNEGFEQILAQLQQLDNISTGRRLSKRLQLIVAETRAEINFEMVEVLQERELAEWTRLGAARNPQSHRAGQRIIVNSEPEATSFCPG